MKNEDFLNSILDFFISPNFPPWFQIIKFIFIFFGFFFLGYILWAVFNTSFLGRFFLWDLKEFLFFKPHYSKKFLTKWKKIERRILSGIDSDFKLAILEADELLNECLISLGYGTGSLDENIEKLNEDIVKNLKDLKNAHQVRNDIVADPSYKISFEETKKILTVYEKALKDLQAI